MNGERDGFLLLEALIALSLLALGVGAAGEAFAQARAAGRRGEKRARLGDCALMRLETGADACGNEFRWREETHPLTPRLEMVALTAAWEERGSVHEQTFETVRRATWRI